MCLRCTYIYIYIYIRTSDVLIQDYLKIEHLKGRVRSFYFYFIVDI